MNNIIKWTIVFAISVIGLVSTVAIKRHRLANSLGPALFKWHPDHGFVVPIPEGQARFMGLPMFMSITAGLNGPTNEDLNRASRALSALSQCVHIAEQRLIEFERQRGITSNDIQNPQVWIDPEAADKSRWTIVVEKKDHDGFGWHIEFKDAEFDEIWAGS